MMKITVFTLLTLSLALATTKSTSADPNVREGKTLFDLRKIDKELRDHPDFETSYSTDNSIDISSEKAARVFKELKMIEQTEGHVLDMRMKYILHTDEQRDAGMNRVLEEWGLKHGSDGLFDLTVRLRVLDLNNLQLEGGVQESTISYHCKEWSDMDVHVCIPSKCDFHGIEQPTDPVKVCVTNYRQSQIMLNVVNEATNTQQPVKVGEETQLLIVHCIQTHIETITIYGDNICYYKGYEPQNIVSYEEMHNKIVANGDWVETEKAGSYQRSTVVKEWQVDSLIDLSVPDLIGEKINTIREYDPAGLESIQEQLQLLDIDMEKGTTYEASGGSD